MTRYCETNAIGDIQPSITTLTMSREGFSLKLRSIPVVGIDTGGIQYILT